MEPVLLIPRVPETARSSLQPYRWITCGQWGFIKMKLAVITNTCHRMCGQEWCYCDWIGVYACSQVSKPFVYSEGQKSVINGPVTDSITFCQIVSILTGTASPAALWNSQTTVHTDTRRKEERVCVLIHFTCPEITEGWQLPVQYPQSCKVFVKPQRNLLTAKWRYLN